MKVHRIYGLLLRYLFYFRRSFDRLSDVFYWPTIDLILWGITSTYLRSIAPDANQIVTIIISGLLFWIIVWRGQYEVTINLLSELWDKNLINLFVSPLKFWEWIMSFVIMGFIKAVISFAFAATLAFFLYQVDVFRYGFYMIPFILMLLMMGWAVGFLIAAVLLRYGTKLQTLAWSTIYIVSPFSAVYYPVSILPEWAQKVAFFVPASHIFEGTREVIETGTLDWNKVWISLTLNIIYMTIALFFLRRSFNATLEKGLAKVY
jgi:ABC-2 type transport system permease protein